MHNYNLLHHWNVLMFVQPKFTLSVGFSYPTYRPFRDDNRHITMHVTCTQQTLHSSSDCGWN